MTELPVDAMTWTALLGQWMDFAKAARALPADGSGGRWQAVVSDVINLQAVSLALGELEKLPGPDRPFARDRAELLIHGCADRIETVWRGEVLPESLTQIMDDAARAFAASAYAGAAELTWLGPDVLVMPAVPTGDAEGTLLVMAPGTLVMPGEPVAWWADRDGTAIAAALPECHETRPAIPHQVYRELDQDGAIVRDVITPVLADPMPGLPLLVPLFEHGHAIGGFTMDADVWEERQRQALAGRATVPVHNDESR